MHTSSITGHIHVYKFSWRHLILSSMYKRKITYLSFSLLCDSVFIIPAFNIDPKSTLRIGQIIVGINVQWRNGLGAWGEAEPLHDCHHCHLRWDGKLSELIGMTWWPLNKDWDPYGY